MKFAFVAPVEALKEARKVHKLGSYHLALVQNILFSPNTLDLYCWCHDRGDFIILDNGEAEGKRGDFNDVLGIAALIGADEIVLPDVLRNRTATTALIREWAEKVPPIKRAVVPQGKDAQEWIQCYRDIVDDLDGYFATICVPKHLGVAGRVEVLNYLHNNLLDAEYNIHLLGLSAHPSPEFKAYGNTGCRIRGIDSAAPLAWAQHDRSIEYCVERFSVDWNGFGPVKVMLKNLEFITQEANRV